ncbi:Spermine/spermidine synthase family protein (fragment) [Paraburkholderia piptadeniae]|uniref:Spermine/spermidine synthase family protein n=1 Tax=Paraburkholderia piptadeniae TaxID=1701573 RepID=A0A1N7STG3_9BURK
MTGSVRQHRGRPAHRKGRHSGDLDVPMVIETEHLLSLCFDARGVQSCMLRKRPDALALGYTRTMMGFVLLHPGPRHISMIGLGGGSLAKYCYRHLPNARITAVEINREVIALRERFHIPPDDGRLTVLCADGTHYVSSGEIRSDVLVLDGFVANGLPRELGSRGFYEACHRHLNEDGVLVANFLSDDPHLACYATCLAHQ